MPSIDSDQRSLSAVVRSYLSWTIEWPVMNVAAVQDSISSDSVQPQAGIEGHRPLRSGCGPSLAQLVPTLNANKRSLALTR